MTYRVKECGDGRKQGSGLLEEGEGPGEEERADGGEGKALKLVKNCISKFPHTNVTIMYSKRTLTQNF